MSCKLQPRLRVALYCGDKPVVDEDLAQLLLAVERTGSIVGAARLLGISYSRAWDCIARAERLLGARLVEARRGGRGGGGARLTEEARRILAEYLEAYERLTGRRLELPPAAGQAGGEAWLYAGSHDFTVEALLGVLREEGLIVEAHWIGSLKGVAAVLLGEADLAGIHIYTEQGYNLPYLRSTLPRGTAIYVRGYMRSVGLASRKPLTWQEAARGLLEGKLRLANRARGTGTRLLLDKLLEREARRMGVDPREIPLRVKGYETEARTHLEAAGMVARGEADVALVVEAAARIHGLHYTHLAWERFDFTAPIDRKDTPLLQKFTSLLKSRAATDILARLPGYKPAEDMGEVEEV